MQLLCVYSTTTNENNCGGWRQFAALSNRFYSFTGVTYVKNGACLAVDNAFLDCKTINEKQLPEGSVCVKILAVAAGVYSPNINFELNIGRIYAIPRKDLMKNNLVDGKLALVNF